VGVCALLLITGLVYVTAIGAAVYTILTAPMRLRLGRARRVLAIAVTYASIEIVGLAVASWRWVRFFLDRDADRDREDLPARCAALFTSCERPRTGSQGSKSSWSPGPMNAPRRNRNCPPAR